MVSQPNNIQAPQCSGQRSRSPQLFQDMDSEMLSQANPIPNGDAVSKKEENSLYSPSTTGSTVMLNLNDSFREYQPEGYTFISTSISPYRSSDETSKSEELNGTAGQSEEVSGNAVQSEDVHANAVQSEDAEILMADQLKRECKDLIRECDEVLAPIDGSHLDMSTLSVISSGTNNTTTDFSGGRSSQDSPTCEESNKDEVQENEFSEFTSGVNASSSPNYLPDIPSSPVQPLRIRVKKIQTSKKKERFMILPATAPSTPKRPRDEDSEEDGAKESVRRHKKAKNPSQVKSSKKGAKSVISSSCPESSRQLTSVPPPASRAAVSENDKVKVRQISERIMHDLNRDDDGMTQEEKEERVVEFISCMEQWLLTIIRRTPKDDDDDGDPGKNITAKEAETIRKLYSYAVQSVSASEGGTSGSRNGRGNTEEVIRTLNSFAAQGLAAAQAVSNGSNNDEENFSSSLSPVEVESSEPSLAETHTESTSSPSAGSVKGYM